MNSRPLATVFFLKNYKYERKNLQCYTILSINNSYEIISERFDSKTVSFCFQWQETQDFGRKKEIRTHMYKLREARLRNLYDMDTTGANYGVSKTSSHGDLVADHSFASLKAKEVRDSESPTR